MKRGSKPSQLASFGELDGAEFAARIGIEKDGRDEHRNTIRLVIEPDHQDYAELIQSRNSREGGSGGGHGSGGAPAAAAPMTGASVVSTNQSGYAPRVSGVQGRPAWAQ